MSINLILNLEIVTQTSFLVKYVEKIFTDSEN